GSAWAGFSFHRLTTGARRPTDLKTWQSCVLPGTTSPVYAMNCRSRSAQRQLPRTCFHCWEYSRHWAATLRRRTNRRGSAVVMLTWSVFERRFAGDPKIVGGQIHLDGKPY